MYSGRFATFFGGLVLIMIGIRIFYQRRIYIHEWQTVADYSALHWLIGLGLTLVGLWICVKRPPL